MRPGNVERVEGAALEEVARLVSEAVREDGVRVLENEAVRLAARRTASGRGEQGARSLVGLEAHGAPTTARPETASTEPGVSASA